jgi:Tfp pilus assembly protein PilO
VVSSFQFSQGKNTKVGANQVNISFALNGKRNQILQFLRAIEASPRFLGMKTFGLTTSFKDNVAETAMAAQLYSFYMK